MWMWLLFFFVAFGSKVVLAVATIYLLFPSERSCSACDGDTVPLVPGPVGRAAQAVLLHTVQRRWCPACGWEGFTRTGRLGRGAVPTDPRPSRALR